MRIENKGSRLTFILSHKEELAIIITPRRKEVARGCIPPGPYSLDTDKRLRRRLLALYR